MENQNWCERSLGQESLVNGVLKKSEVKVRINVVQH